MLLTARVCGGIGHWIALEGTYFDAAEKCVYARWKCRICGQRAVAKLRETERAQHRQTWIVSCAWLIAIWGFTWLISGAMAG